MTHALDARQRAMLAEMGIRLWQPPDRPAAAASAPSEAVAPSAAVLQRPPPSTPPPPTHPPIVPPAAERSERAAQLRPEGVESMDWASLQAAVAACRACALCEGRTQTVFGVGARQADWMVVGEAPGDTEDRRGEPFVGPAGQLLDNMLAAIGLSRAAGAASESPATSEAPGGARQGVYIANVLKCRPPNNRNPQPDEIAQCEPYLRRQVALVQPKIILAMGRFAVQSLLQTSEPIGKLRGRVHHYQGVPVVVTYHPAYLLRTLPDKAKAWADLCLARATLAP